MSDLWSSDPAVFGLVVGLASLALLPCLPVVPGLGGLLTLVLGWQSYRRATRRRWLASVTMMVGGAGLVLALVQLGAALFAALRVVSR